MPNEIEIGRSNQSVERETALAALSQPDNNYRNSQFFDVKNFS